MGRAIGRLTKTLLTGLAALTICTSSNASLPTLPRTNQPAENVEITSDIERPYDLAGPVSAHPILPAESDITTLECLEELCETNLSSDFYRHPGNQIVREFIQEIISDVADTNDPSLILDTIQQFLTVGWVHGVPQGWQSDIDLIENYRETGKFNGTCSSDAVLVSSMMRSVGIPSRIVYATFDLTARGRQQTVCPPLESLGYEPHFWTEAYIDGRWVPVGADNFYPAVGIDDFNRMLAGSFPGGCYDFQNIVIVDYIGPDSGDWDGFEWSPYDGANNYCIGDGECVLDSR